MKNESEECPRYKKPSKIEHTWSLMAFFTLLVTIFITPFYQFGKQFILMKRTQSFRAIIVESICLSLFFSIFILLQFWTWVFALSLMLILPVFVGTFYKINKAIVQNIKLSETVINQQAIDEKIEEKPAPTPRPKKSEVSSFRTDDGKQILTVNDDLVQQWLAKNPDLKVEQK